MGVAIAAAVAGAGLLAGSGIMGANAAKDKENKYKKIANTPGLDFGEITRSALGGYESNYGAASSLSRKLALANQEQLNAQEELALPGIAAARQKQLSFASGLFGDASNEIKRLAGAWGVGQGVGGSAFNAISGNLRIGEALTRQRGIQGSQVLSALIGGSKLANTRGIDAFLGPTISEQVNQRSLERTQRMNMLANAAGIASGKEQGAGMMGQVGGMLLGGGMLGMMGGGGGGMTSPGNWTGGGSQTFMPSLSQQQLMMNERTWTPPSNYPGAGGFGGIYG